MAFEVRGYIDGVAYNFRHDPAADTPNQGSTNVLAKLEFREGETFGATPTGPYARLNLRDGESILTALYALTQVVAVEGDAPDVFGPMVPGAVY